MTIARSLLEFVRWMMLPLTYIVIRYKRVPIASLLAANTVVLIWDRDSGPGLANLSIMSHLSLYSTMRVRVVTL